jgi:hypothetical protein
MIERVDLVPRVLHVAQDRTDDLRDGLQGVHDSEETIVGHGAGSRGDGDVWRCQIKAPTPSRTTPGSTKMMAAWIKTMTTHEESRSIGTVALDETAKVAPSVVSCQMVYRPNPQRITPSAMSANPMLAWALIAGSTP